MSRVRRQFDWSVLRGETQRTVSSTTEDRPPRARDRFELADESSVESAAALPLRVNDLKQHAYCPRIVFYQYAMPVAKKATFKMERGKSIEPRIEDLERRRKLRKYGLDRGERHFQVWLNSARLGLSGRLDLLIKTPDALYPVDFKDTVEPVRYNHHVQLCAYALLIEDTFPVTVSAGFVYRVPRHDVSAIAMTENLRRDTIDCIREMRAMIRSERMPPPTNLRARCTDCEYRNYCGDVF